MADTAARPTPDLILHRGRFTTLDRAHPLASAVAIKDGRFVAVGGDEILASAGPATRIVDLQGKGVLPGLIDNHLHIIRGGLNFNMELRWDGVRNLADAMAMLRRQVAVTPAPQWVRVVGGFTEHQFAEKRLPTIDELNAAAPDTPVFILHLYDRALLNGAALRAVGYTKDTPEPPGGQIVRDAAGNPTGLLLARPNAAILYATLAKGPKLPFDYQLNSTRHFMRELNRLGVTGAIDAGGGFQNYPDDYAVIERLAKDGQLTIRLAYNLFTQKPEGGEAGFPELDRVVDLPRRHPTISGTTARARCWCSRRPISRTSASRAPICRRRWKASSRRSCACSRRTVGRGGCTRRTTKRSAARSTCSSA
ncbi:amidohydrolase family protein [Burkholderia pseudomallei MSHR684]|nr:amidohydrolase family protein [Burkholderia pseudomallei MSHR684]